MGAMKPCRLEAEALVMWAGRRRPGPLPLISQAPAIHSLPLGLRPKPRGRLAMAVMDRGLVDLR